MIKTIKMGCGVRLVMEHIPYVQSASIGLWTKTGSVNESKKNKGISHFIEHMMFKGTERRSAKEIAEDVDKIGSHMNAFTGKEATCYYIKTLATNIDQSVDVILDMFMNSKFDKEEMEKEKNVICEEIKMIEDSPEDDIHDLICEIVFKGTPLAQSIIGTPSSLRGISRNTIKKYIENEYTKDSVVVSVTGNFDEEHIISLLADKLSGLKETKEYRETENIDYVPGYRVKVKDIEQSHICLGTRGLKLDEDRYYALAVLSSILGGGMSSRLFQNIREQKGLAYSVYSSSSSFVDMGIFSIYAAVSHDKVTDALMAIKEELVSLQKEGVTSVELAAAKEQLKGSYIFSQENVNGRMFSIGKNMTLLGKVFLPEEVIAGINNVTLDDVRNVSKLVDRFEDYSAILITNRKMDLKSWMLKQ